MLCDPQLCSYAVAVRPFDATGAALSTATAYAALDLNLGDIVGATARKTGPITAVNLIIQFGNIAADWDGTETLRVQTSADNSAWSDISGASFTRPTAAGYDGKILVISFPTGGSCLRYLRLIGTAGAGATIIGAVWQMWHSGQSPSSATERGTTEAIFGTGITLSGATYTLNT